MEKAFSKLSVKDDSESPKSNSSGRSFHSNSNQNQSSKSKYKQWSINGWLKGVNRKNYNSAPKTSPTLRESPSNLFDNLSDSSSTIKKSIIPSKEKEKILNYLSPSILVSPKSEINNYVNRSKASCSLNNDEKHISSPNTGKFPKIEKVLSERLKVKQQNDSIETDSSDCCCTSSSPSPETTKRAISTSWASSGSSSSYPLSNSSNGSPAAQNKQYLNRKLAQYTDFLPNEAAIGYFTKKADEWKYFRSNLVDSHCHLDMIFYRLRYEKTAYEYFEDYKCFHIKNFEACINVICDPVKFFTKQRLDKYLEKYGHPKVFSTIGCHPHFANAWSKQIENIISSVLDDPKIVAVGECGFDASKKNNVSIEQQKVAFEAQLRLANDSGKPIVIHCRDTEELCYEFMKKHLKTNHRIHLHCFTGNWSITEKYLNTFENLYVGVTPLACSNYSSAIRENISKIPLNRLLLETDAPYFVPRTNEFPPGIDCSHPGFVYSTAECIAEVKNTSLDLVLDFNRRNVKKVYGF